VLEKKPGGPAESSTVSFEFAASGQKGTARVLPELWRPSNAQDVAVLRVEPKPEISEPTDDPAGTVTGWVTEGRPVVLPLGYTAHLREGVAAAERVLRTFGYLHAKTKDGLPGLCQVVGTTQENGFDVFTFRTVEVTTGFSGAPVWDEDLKAVVGMVVSFLKRGEGRGGGQTGNASFIPIETIRDACPDLALPQGEPYRSLDAFEEHHAAFYHGREAASSQLVNMLGSHDFVAVVGVSGSGKSSLVKAGLVKGLRAAGSSLAERTRVRFVAGPDPLVSLVHAVEQQVPGVPRPVSEYLGISRATAVSPREMSLEFQGKSVEELARGLRAFADSHPLLLVCDQFERLFTECTVAESRERFASVLLRSACRNLKVLIAVRADYFGRVLEHEEVGRAVSKAQLTLLPMGEAELRDAIELPARSLFRYFQAGVVDRLIGDVRGRAGDLPLLQFALTELWSADHAKGVMTKRTYDGHGFEDRAKHTRVSGIQGAIIRRAESYYERLSDQAERERCGRLFRLLVDAGVESPSGSDTSRRILAAELDDQSRALADSLADTFLLTTSEDPLTSQRTYEVSHESLIKFWPRLKGWATEQRDLPVWYKSVLIPNYRQFLHSRSPDDYLGSHELVTAARWLKAEGDAPPSEIHRYVRESLRYARRRTAVRRWFGVALGVALAAAVCSAFIAQRRDAEARYQYALRESDRKIREIQASTEAKGRLDTLKVVKFKSIHLIAKDLIPHRQRVEASLREMVGASNPTKQRVRGSIALLAWDVSQVPFLRERLVQADRYGGKKKDNLTPEEGEAIRKAFEVNQTNFAGGLGNLEAVWPQLRRRDEEDPSVRSELIHDLRFGVERSVLTKRLLENVVNDYSERQALILTLGEYPDDPYGQSDYPALVKKLLDWYRTDRDPGVHGAVDWLLRKPEWQGREKLDRIDCQLVTRDPPSGRDWYVNRQGQTFTVVRGPKEFIMGSPRPEQEANYVENELQHKIRIDRSFAIATKEVTVRDYKEFKADGGEGPDLSPDFLQQYNVTDECPLTYVDWYVMARYFNWLSKREGFDKDQLCYLPNGEGRYANGMKIARDVFQLHGYRLPTEAEWEYSCRARTQTTYPHGSNTLLLGEYAWYVDNFAVEQKGRARPVGQKKPNDLGLFDILGSAGEWTQCLYDRVYPAKTDGTPRLDDCSSCRSVLDGDKYPRVFRGGKYFRSVSQLRAAFRLVP
jgi:formylglycine-generating enzyme required for sulfatase activity